MTLLGVGVRLELESVVVSVEVRATMLPAIVTSAMPLEQYLVNLQAPFVICIMVLPSYAYPADLSAIHLLVHAFLTPWLPSVYESRYCHMSRYKPSEHSYRN